MVHCATVVSSILTVRFKVIVFVSPLLLSSDFFSDSMMMVVLTLGSWLAMQGYMG